MSVFKDKTLLITGGTGSFGNAVLNRFLRTDIGEIRIFSREYRELVHLGVCGQSGADSAAGDAAGVLEGL